MAESNLNKLSKIRDFRRNVNEFAEYCKSKGIYLFDCENPITSIDAEEIIFQMFDINKEELEKERQAVIDSIK